MPFCASVAVNTVSIIMMTSKKATLSIGPWRLHLTSGPQQHPQTGTSKRLMKKKQPQSKTSQNSTSRLLPSLQSEERTQPFSRATASPSLTSSFSATTCLCLTTMQTLNLLKIKQRQRWLRHLLLVNISLVWRPKWQTTWPLESRLLFDFKSNHLTLYT